MVTYLIYNGSYGITVGWILLLSLLVTVHSYWCEYKRLTSFAVETPVFSCVSTPLEKSEVHFMRHWWQQVGYELVHVPRYHSTRTETDLKVVEKKQTNKTHNYDADDVEGAVDASYAATLAGDPGEATVSVDARDVMVVVVDAGGQKPQAGSVNNYLETVVGHRQTDDATQVVR